MVDQWFLNFLTAVEIIFIIIATLMGGALIWINKIAPLPGASLERKKIKDIVKEILIQGIIAIALIIAILNWPYLASLAVSIWIINRTARKVLDTI